MTVSQCLVRADAESRDRVAPENPLDLVAREFRDLACALERHQLLVTREDRASVTARKLQSALIGIVMLPRPPQLYLMPVKEGYTDSSDNGNAHVDGRFTCGATGQVGPKSTHMTNKGPLAHPLVGGVMPQTVV